MPLHSSPLRARAFAFSFILLGLAISGNLRADIDFAHDIVPILKSQCAKCHGGEEREGAFSINTRDLLLKGGEHGPAVKIGDAASSLLLERVLTADSSKRMPPEGEALTETQVRKLKEWINSGVAWENGYTFAKSVYEPPLKLRKPSLPDVHQGRLHPIDRLLDADCVARGESIPRGVDDAVFARRVWLDLHGLLPTPEELQAFLNDPRTTKRQELVRRLLADKRHYAEHWLSFWNDLLRNDYGGTGFITGGRTQISAWLYRSLIENKPYDKMAKELIAPSAESAGFAQGIRWRGTVSAGQTVEIQFAQSVGQAFLGINLKCASCHDSFIDRWKLEDAYGLAAIYSQTPLDIHRCDKPIGKRAVAAWLFPEIGTIDGTLPQPERLKQLAGFMTHPDNGRFPRTIVNRIWHRLMGRGIVEPVDAMQTQPWHEDLLEWLANDLVEHGFDLKHTMEMICTSQAYQSKVEPLEDANVLGPYVYRGPRAKRMTAEQWVDTVWQLTKAAPNQYDAPVLRGEASPESEKIRLLGKWIWNRKDADRAPEGERVTFRKTLELDEVPLRAAAIVTCDNSFELFVNGKKVASGQQWDRVEGVLLTKHLRKGANEFVFACTNAGSSPNPAGAFLEARFLYPDQVEKSLVTDATWEWSNVVPDKNGKWKGKPEWKSAEEVANPNVWMAKLEKTMRSQLLIAQLSQEWMVRCSLLKSDAFQKTLGRPNRDQIVTQRPNAWSTLEALDLTNAQVLDGYLAQGAKYYCEEGPSNNQKLVEYLYLYGLSRSPTKEESSLALGMIGLEKPKPEDLQDLLWSLVMLPEFQLIR